MDESSTYELELPGFRFHPTEEELLSFYLHSMVFGKKLRGDIIGFLNIYKHDPRELPGTFTYIKTLVLHVTFHKTSSVCSLAWFEFRIFLI